MTDSRTVRHRREVILRPRAGGVLVAVAAAALSVLTACSGSDTAVRSDATTPTTESVLATMEPTPPATVTPTTDPPATDPPATVAARYDFSAIGPVVDQFVTDRGLHGAGLVVVDREDGIVHEEYWGEFDADRISLIASSSKMLVAGVLLDLQDAGLLDVDAPVADVADWGAGNPSITPAQLVSNSSGLPGLLPDPAYGPYVCQYVPAGTLQECAAAIFSSTADDADVIAPDTEFRYGGAQWQVAGAVAEVASGKSWAQLIDETYRQPCDVESLGFNNHWTQFGSIGFEYPVEFAGDPSTLTPTDNPNMEGGAYITAPDYGALLLMHLRDGRCGDTQVLSPAALDVLHADRTGPTYASTTSYAMGWFVDAANDRISDPGAYGAVPWLDLADGYGAYLVVEADGGTGNELAARLYPLVETAITNAH